MLGDSRRAAERAATIIERNSLFRGLPRSDDRRRLPRSRPAARYESAIGRLHARRSGRCALWRRDRARPHQRERPGGKEVFLNIMEPGDAFGEIALLDGQPRTAAATTLAPTELMIIRREHFLALVKREPQLAVHLIELLCKRVRWTSEQMEDSSLLDVPARLAKRLLSLATSHGRKTAAGAQLKLSQEDLAQFLGPVAPDRQQVSADLEKARAGSRSAAAASHLSTSARCASSHERTEEVGLKPDIPNVIALIGRALARHPQCHFVDSLREQRSPSCASPDRYSLRRYT